MTQESESDMRKVELSDRYNIILKGKEVFSGLSQSEYFDIMQDYAIEFYQTGHPNEDELKTTILSEDEWLKQKQD